MSPCPAEETSHPRPEGPCAGTPDPRGDPGAASRLVAPSPEAVEFIRFCRFRRRVGWPELYDEMILVACRGLFHGYGFDELARCGVAFNLAELPRLAGLVALVVAEERPPVEVGAARRGRAVVGGRVVGRGDAGLAAKQVSEETPEPARAPAGTPALATS